MNLEDGLDDIAEEPKNYKKIYEMGRRADGL